MKKAIRIAQCMSDDIYIYRERESMMNIDDKSKEMGIVLFDFHIFFFSMVLINQTP